MEHDPNQSLMPNWEAKISDFDDLNLKTELLKGIYTKGYEELTDLQSKVILPLINGRDVIVQHVYGHDRASCLGIAMLQLVDEDLIDQQILVLEPTREHAVNVGHYCYSLKRELNINIDYNINQDTKAYKDEPKKFQIVFGTPGRILSDIQKGYINAKHIKLFVIDECDEILGRLYLQQVLDIRALLGPKVQTAIFTSTVNVGEIRCANKVTNNPAIIVTSKQLVHTA